MMLKVLPLVEPRKEGMLINLKAPQGEVYINHLEVPNHEWA